MMDSFAIFFDRTKFWFEYLTGVDDRHSIGNWEHMFRHGTFCLCVSVFSAVLLMTIAIFLRTLGYDKPPSMLVEYDYIWFAPFAATVWMISLSLNRKISKKIKSA